MFGPGMTDRTIIPGGECEAQVTRCAVPIPPVSSVTAGSGFIVAANTEILPVTNAAAISVQARVESVGSGSPHVAMVRGQSSVMTLDAVVFPVAGKAGVSCLPRCEPIQIRRLPVVPRPLYIVGYWLRKGNSFCLDRYKDIPATVLTTCRRIGRAASDREK